MTAPAGEPRPHCQAPGCGRFASAGREWCPRHDPEEPTVADVAAAVVAPDQAEAARAEFRRRLEEGRYAALFDRRLADVIAEAAERMDVKDEIGVLRYVMAKVIAEESDPVELADATTRLVSAIVAAARAQRAIQGDVADSLTQAITQILAELDAGQPVGGALEGS